MPRKKLSASEMAVLRETLRGGAKALKTRTLSAFVRRGLMESNGNLTIEGWRHAVSSMTLPEQCALLGLSFEQIEGLHFSKEPERALWKDYLRQGFEGAYCEAGPILLIVRAAALDVLAELNPFGSREDACNRFTEAQLKIHETNIPAIVSAVERADRSSLLRGFREIYSSPLTQRVYPGLTESAISEIFSALGNSALRELTEAIAEDPYQYRAGWPDLTLAKDGEMLWVEVKTTDTLHMSQIITMSKMKPLLPGRLVVAQLIAP